MTVKPEHYQQLDDMRALGMTWPAIAKAFGCYSHDQVSRSWYLRRENAEQRSKRLAQRRAYRKQARRVRNGSWTADQGRVYREEIDPEMLWRRDEALAVELTPNQYFLGDPLPGRSALDRRMGP